MVSSSTREDTAGLTLGTWHASHPHLPPPVPHLLDRCGAMMTAPGLTGTVQASEATAVLVLVGEVDLSSAATLRSLLHQAAAEGDYLVVDMSGVTFCDARGLTELVTTSKELQARGCHLSVRGPTLSVQRLFKATGLWDYLAVAEGDLLLHGLAAAVQLPLVQQVLDAALTLVVTMSQSVLSGADGVSVTLPRAGRLGTVASSNHVVLQMDHDQYDTGQGPCLDAATQGTPVLSPELESEQRWPRFVGRARAHGINSIMSSPLLDGEVPLGALNVYSRAPHAFADHEQQWAAQFAREAAQVVVSAPTGSLDQAGAALAVALRGREVIAQAQGIVMARRQSSADDAYRFLVDVSRTTSRPLTAICGDVVRTVGPASAREDHRGPGA